jgi:hypothetical protein
MSYFYAHNSVSNTLKWRPRLKIWKSGALLWDPEREEAWSYNWCFAKRINGKMVFNEYRYSNTTTRHQSEIHSFFRSHKIKIDLTVNCHGCLKNDSGAGPQAVERAIRGAADTGDFRDARAIARVFRVPFSRAVIDQVIETMEVELCDAYLERAFQYQEDKLNAILERLGEPTYYPTHAAGPNDAAQPTSEVFPWGA